MLSLYEKSASSMVPLWKLVRCFSGECFSKVGVSSACPKRPEEYEGPRCCLSPRSESLSSLTKALSQAKDPAKGIALVSCAAGPFSHKHRYWDELLFSLFGDISRTQLLGQRA